MHSASVLSSCKGKLTLSHLLPRTSHAPLSPTGIFTPAIAGTQLENTCIIAEVFKIGKKLDGEGSVDNRPSLISFTPLKKKKQLTACLVSCLVLL